MISQLTIQRFNEGDHKAFKEIFDSMFGLAWAHLMRFDKVSKEDKEDILSISFMSLWNRRGNFEAEAQIRVFLMKCVHSRSLNVIEHSTVRIEWSKKFKYIFTEDEPPYEEPEIDMDKYLSILPKKSKKIMELTVQGLTNTEICQELSLTMQTVKNQKVRALKILRREFVVPDF